MTSRRSAIIYLPTADATSALAQQIAPHLKPGNTVLLSGELGSGKTHFARALINTCLASAGRLEDIPSPTYTLVQIYFDGTHDIWHADLYRLTDPEEIIELGLLDAMQDCICLIEWPDRLGAYRPKDALNIELLYSENHDARTAKLTFSPQKWAFLQPILEKHNV